MLLKMPQKLLKTAHYMELGSYQHWPVLLPQRIRLYTYEQIPLFLKENPYITDGYRAHLPSKLCLRRWKRHLLIWHLFYCSLIFPEWRVDVQVSSLQHFYPVQWDREHLEPPSWFPALLLSGGQWPLVCPAGLWGQQGGLCHLCYRTLLLPGNCWLTEDSENQLHEITSINTKVFTSFMAVQNL